MSERHSNARRCPPTRFRFGPHSPLPFVPTQRRHYLRFPIALRMLQALDQLDVRRNAKIGVWACPIRLPGPTVRHEFQRKNLAQRALQGFEQIIFENPPTRISKTSATGTRTRVTRVRAEHPNQLDYGGSVCCMLLVCALECLATDRFTPDAFRWQTLFGVSIVGAQI